MKAIKRLPMRMCAICGSRLPKREMLRLVRSADGQISVDLTGKKPGRGLYICHSPECEAKARRGSRLEKLTGARVGDEVKDQLKSAGAGKDAGKDIEKGAGKGVEKDAGKENNGI